MTSLMAQLVDCFSQRQFHILMAQSLKQRLKFLFGPKQPNLAVVPIRTRHI